MNIITNEGYYKTIKNMGEKTMNNMNFTFGDIIIADLGFNVGAEQNKIRPVVVIKQFNNLLTVVPIASKMKKEVSHINLTTKDTLIPNYIPKEERKYIKGTIVTEQMKTISCDDVKTPQAIAKLLNGTKTFLSKIIKKTLGLEGYYNFTERYNKVEEKKNTEILISELDSTLSIDVEEKIYKRGEILNVNFGETNIEELNGLTKVVVLSPNYANKHNQTIIVTPIVSLENKDKANNYFYLNEKEGIDLSIIRTIDKERIVTEVDKLKDKEYKFMDMVIENLYPVKVLFEYKIMAGISSCDKDIVIL